MKKNAFAISFVLIFACLFLSCVYFLYNTMYPVKYLKIIEPEAKEFNVSVPLILSVINAESSFNPNAISPIGAIGLMQVMPTTAEFIASKIGYNNKIDLFDSKCNIKLGVAYIGYLQNRFLDLDSVICAYNAGEGVVRMWQRDKKGNLIIEYKETQNYLTKVKNYLSIYSKKVK